MEDLESENGVAERNGEGESESLVPDRASRSGIVGSSGEAAFGVDPEDGVWFEVAVLPIDVLEVFGGDDCEFHVERLRRRWPRSGGHD